MRFLLIVMFLITFSCIKLKKESSPPSHYRPPASINHQAMVFVPGGRFKMGCEQAKDSFCPSGNDEKLHEVIVDSFHIDKYEVTFKRYQKCIDAGNCGNLAEGGALNFGWPGVENYPVNGVTWLEAKKFCEWEGRRLPTEAEWERAARGDDERIYPWGNQAPSCDRTVMDKKGAGFLGCGTGTTMDVGSKPKGASPYGAHDMAGNLWEWVADWYDKDYYASSALNNPKGPSSGTHKVARGGDFFTRTGYEVRSSGRFFYEPSDYSIAIGFRCAK